MKEIVYGKDCGNERYKRDCQLAVSSRMRVRIGEMPLVASRLRRKRGDISSAVDMMV